jgi:hypothetical protein
MVTEVAVVVVVVLLGGAVYLGLQIARRLSQVTAALNRLPTDVSAHAADAQAAAIAALTEPGPRFDSPVTRLTFQESLDPNRFAEVSIASAKASLARALASRTGDGVTVTIQSVRLLKQGAEMIVSASDSGRELLYEGKPLIPFHTASGARLPLLMDARTGKIIEQLKEIPISTLTSKLASISSVVVGAAHLVAGADLAKRLARVDSKLDLLLASRRIDQIAKLERIYISARELGSHEMDHERRLEMWRLRGELRELRSAWRQELHLKLDQIEDPANAPYFQRLFSTKRSIDRRVSGGIGEGEAQVTFIEYSMRFEHVLAVGSGTLDEFQDSLQSELQQLDQIRGVLQTKAAYISGHYPNLSVHPMIESLSAVVTTYRELLPTPGTHDPDVIDADAS